MNREKSNSGIGLDLLANKDKTRKTNDSFFGNQNISLEKENDLNDIDILNDDDSYKFMVKDNNDNTNLNELEKLNTYHDTFTEPKNQVHYLKSKKFYS